jgi:hypothetical protein
VNTANKGILVGALEVHLDELLVFENRHFGLVAIRRNDQIFCHENSPLPEAGERSNRKDSTAELPRICPARAKL